MTHITPDRAEQLLTRRETDYAHDWERTEERAAHEAGPLRFPPMAERRDEMALRYADPQSAAFLRAQQAREMRRVEHADREPGMPPETGTWKLEPEQRAGFRRYYRITCDGFRVGALAIAADGQWYAIHRSHNLQRADTAREAVAEFWGRTHYRTMWVDR